MKKSLIFILLISNSIFAWNARIVPLFYDTQFQRWEVLLRTSPSGKPITDFFEDVKKGEHAMQVALKALNLQTNNAYSKENILYYNSPAFKTPKGDWVHFVIVTDQKLLSDPKFSWIDINSITATTNISTGVKIMLTSYLSDALKQLVLLRKSIISTPLTPLKPKNSVSWGTADQPNPNTLYFYQKADPTYIYTNFYEHPQGRPLFQLQNYKEPSSKLHEWKTSEHYFQAQKFVGTPIYDAVKNAATSRDAFTVAQQNASSIRSDWHKGVKEIVMLDTVRAKFMQNQKLLDELMKTGNQILVEDARANDDTWGNGADGKGGNYLGQILMQVRSEQSSGGAAGPATT